MLVESTSLEFKDGSLFSEVIVATLVVGFVVTSAESDVWEDSFNLKLELLFVSSVSKLLLAFAESDTSLVAV